MNASNFKLPFILTRLDIGFNRCLPSKACFLLWSILCCYFKRATSKNGLKILIPNNCGGNDGQYT